MTADAFGEAVLGPIVGEFCLRLWLLCASFQNPGQVRLLFCARGGLRMQEAYARFTRATKVSPAVEAKPLMVSRVVAMRAALVASLDQESGLILPSAARTLYYEFGVTKRSLCDVAHALTGVRISQTGHWNRAFSPEVFAELLHSVDGEPLVGALREQTGLFREHLDYVREGRDNLILVDTGLHGTTALLLSEAFSDLQFSSVLLASYFPPWRNVQGPRTFGLSLESDGYAPWLPRTALLRYWHLVEWLFEPPLESVVSFERVEDFVKSNLEVPDWQGRLCIQPGSLFTGVLRYIDALPAGPGAHVANDTGQAWRELRRSIVFPRSTEVKILSIGDRSHDFGRDEVFSYRPWNGVVSALRGAAMWREGEIAASRSRLRLPVQIGIEAAYAARRLWRITSKRRA